MVTTFSGDVVRKLLNGKERYTDYFTTAKGEKEILFDIVKRYEDGVESGVGNKIDFYGAWMFAEGNYFSEYLVDKEFLVEELTRDCDLELIDYDLFENQFNIHRDYFENYAKYQSNIKTRQMLLNAGTYYQDNDSNKTMHRFTNLGAYYIFRRKGIDTKTYKKDGQRGGIQKYDLLDKNKFDLLKMENTDTHKSLINSIYAVLTANEISPEEMCKDFGFEFEKDIDLDEIKINKICKLIVIDHTIDNPKDLNSTITENVLDGLNIIMISLDCNNHYDIEYYNKKNKKYIILMKEGTRYYPLYEKGTDDIGIFSGDYDLIKYLMDNGKNVTPTTKTQTKSKTETKTGTKSKTETKSKSKSKTETETKSKSKTGTKSKSKSSSNANKKN